MRAVLFVFLFLLGVQCSREVVLTPCSTQPTRVSAVIIATEEGECPACSGQPVLGLF